MRRTLQHLLYGTVLGLTALFLTPSAHAAETFIRGDVDGDGKITITDAVNTLNYLFKSGSEPGCLDAADVNDDGKIDVADAIGGLNYLFMGANAPPAPFPEAGFDLTKDELGCRGAGDLETIILTSCGVINKPGSYILANDVSSDGTCFTIAASQINFDGKGHTITYGKLGKSDAYGFLLDQVSEVTIENLALENPSDQSSGNDAVHISRSHNNKISRVRISTRGKSDGIEFSESYGNIAELNTISTSGEQSYGIYGFKSFQNTIRDNKIGTTGGNARGIDFTLSENNKLLRNSVKTQGAWAYGLTLSVSSNNEARENEILTEGLGSDDVVIFNGNNNQVISSRLVSQKNNGVFISGYSDSNQVIDTSIAAPGKSEVNVEYFKQPTSTYLTNVVLANNNIKIGKSTTDPKSDANKVFINWYLNAQVMNSFGNPMPQSYVIARHSGSSSDQVFATYSNLEGRIDKQILLGAVQTSQGITFYSYDILASHQGYTNPATLHLDKLENNVDWTAVLGN